MGQAVEGNSMLKRTLKSLCCSNGWSYGVFWRFDQRNPMLLTLEDAYYEEQMGVVIDNMLLQVHMLGEGIIGQAAFTGKHRWIFSDVHGGDWKSVSSIMNQDAYQDGSEFHHQFSSGIKTIAVISVESRGVVQFGSTQKILESSEFLEQTRRLFCRVEHINGLFLSENVPSSLNGEICDPGGLFATSTSSGNFNPGHIKPELDDSCKNQMGNTCPSMNFTESSPFTSGLVNGSRDPQISYSFQPKNQFQMTATEAQVVLSKPSSLSQQLFFQSTTCINNLTANTPCTSAWSSEGSALTSFERQLPSGMRFQDSSNAFSARPNTVVSCRTSVQNFRGDSMINSSYSTAGSVDVGKTNFYNSGKLTDNWNSSPICSTEGGIQEASASLCTFQEAFKPADCMTAVSKPFLMDNILQWLDSSPDQSIDGQAATLNDDLSQAIGVTSASSGLDGGDVFDDIRVNREANSVQSSITNTFNFDGKENSLNVPSAENDLFDSLGLDFESGLVGECWEDIIMPVVSTDISECISEMDVGSLAGPRKGLFSELGLEQLLEDVGSNANSVTKSSSDDQLFTAKRRRMGSLLVNSDRILLAGISCIGGGMTSKKTVYNLDKTTNLGHQKEVVPRSQVGLWIDDSYSINAGSTVTSQSKRPEEPMKATRKRARPGESTRPRPKDRQLFQDRLKELKEIVPNCAKLSIDALLDRTIKHLLFLQSVTKYADRLKQADEPKLIGQENGVVLRENFGGRSGGGGATWAFEVGGQTMVCPIIVEDLSLPGQMLIEMLCEEGGFFLEIADIIRSFGLTILKGVMEVQENKIWAQFTVEANEHITRMDIFMSLVNLLQQTGTSGSNSTNDPNNGIDDGIALFNNYQQPPEPLPVSLADTCR